MNKIKSFFLKQKCNSFKLNSSTLNKIKSQQKIQFEKLYFVNGWDSNAVFLGENTTTFCSYLIRLRSYN